ncbi:hypothetical protein THAOC_23331, partial [Thalassiosira oceanica]
RVNESITSSISALAPVPPACTATTVMLCYVMLCYHYYPQREL